MDGLHGVMPMAAQLFLGQGFIGMKNGVQNPKFRVAQAKAGGKVAIDMVALLIQTGKGLQLVL